MDRHADKSARDDKGRGAMHDRQTRRGILQANHAKRILAQKWIATRLHAARDDGWALLLKYPNTRILVKPSTQVEGFADDFVGFQAVGEGILLGVNEQAHRAESRKSAAKPTPKLV